ncbi:MAG TPA: ankyrin repeat domain-containing protein, partial [Leptospiraceae bacterium]|nr:ankyrin repeat domain-containing protein [Leptospiraceae bacterium]
GIKGNLNSVRFILQKNADKNIKNNDEETALHISVLRAADLTITQHLISEGAYINMKDSDGDTILHMLCIQKTNTEMINTVISGKAKVNSVNQTGKTPLHYAVQFKRTETIEILLKNGADPYLRDLNGHTPEDLKPK